VNRDKIYDWLALGVLALWSSGVGMILLGIWLPSWQWAATGVLAIVLGVFGAIMEMDQ